MLLTGAEGTPTFVSMSAISRRVRAVVHSVIAASTSSTCRARPTVLAIRSSFEQVQAVNRFAQGDPMTFCHANDRDVPVASLVHVVRSHGETGVPVPDPRWETTLALVEVASEDRGQRPHHGLQHGDRHLLTPRRLALGQTVPPWTPAKRCAPPRKSQIAGPALTGSPSGKPVDHIAPDAAWIVRSIAGMDSSLRNPAGRTDKVGVSLVEHVPAEAETFHDATVEVLDEHVRMLDEPEQELAAPRSS